MQEELTESISPNASLSKSTIIDGPCIIEDDVTIDDFCKIKGPTYIGKGSLIGMTSLIRNCMLGNETRIGFNCEIGRSYFAGHDKIPHQNVIVDSLIGENVWFGAYSAVDNVLPEEQTILYEIAKGNAIDTGMDHFGAVIGNNCTIRYFCHNQTWKSYSGRYFDSGFMENIPYQYKELGQKRL